jgi:CBS domain-containing protein
MTTVSQILKSKSDQNIATTTPETSVFDAIKQMADHNVGALVVLDGGRIAGVISERDYARKVALLGRSSKGTPVRDVMTSPVMTVRPDQTNEECMALMTQHRLRHLPVMEGERMVGVISIGDLVKDIISEQKQIIEQLEHYIAGNLA